MSLISGVASFPSQCFNVTRGTYHPLPTNYTMLHLKCVPGVGEMVGLGVNVTVGATVTVVVMVMASGGMISA